MNISTNKGNEGRNCGCRENFSFWGECHIAYTYQIFTDRKKEVISIHSLKVILAGSTESGKIVTFS